MTNASKTIFFSLLFFLFFYLSNSLILSDLTDSTKPLSFLYIHYWFHEQFLINYRELGFVKRGLVGTIMNTNFENYVLLSKIYSLTIISLITVLFSLRQIKLLQKLKDFEFGHHQRALELQPKQCQK